MNENLIEATDELAEYMADMDEVDLQKLLAQIEDVESLSGIDYPLSGVLKQLQQVAKGALEDMQGG